MDNLRLFLVIALSFVVLLLYQAWQQDYGPAPVEPAAVAERPSGESGVEVPAGAEGDVPQSEPVVEDAPVVTETKPALPVRKRIRIETDTFIAELDTLGGYLRKSQLKEYTVSLDDPTPLTLFTDTGEIYLAQSGFAMAEGEGPNHASEWHAAAEEYVMAEGEETLQVPLTWESADGVRVTKLFTFHRGRYDVDVSYTVENRAASAWKGAFYRQLQRAWHPTGGNAMMARSYVGAAIYTPEEFYEKIGFDDIAEQNLQRPDVRGGWVAMLEHYFVSAWVPPADQVNTIYSLYRNGRYYIGMKTPVEEVAAGESRTWGSTIYVGPKIQKELKKLAEGLELTVDYGMLTVIAKPLFWLLTFFHSLTGNWGWAIILLTLTVKIVFFKLSETSYRSMANMRKLQPKMQALKERYGDDKQRMNQAMMELYKKEKINPLGGCLPILVQIPVFIALYWVLLESVEMRQAPWILWIEDLSVADPYYVLPVLMGITMFLSQRLNPAPPDPLQAKIMMALPVVFTFFFLFFPSGLVLYWVVNQTLSVAQQWVITRRIEAGAKK